MKKTEPQFDYADEERRYQERLAEKIICGNCGHHFSKYLTICPECYFGMNKVKKNG